MIFQRIKRFIMGIFDKIFGSINANEKITLAVVGIPHSGKS